ncbi:MAG: excinuclease ABC subunit UvrC, partial [Oscillospiraceae bacterium]|nr:excinuclease ABC subunit UvrC [Oscillospiraceae bacterium]
ARQMVDTATTAFKLPICTKSFPKEFGRNRPCLNHHIGRCMGLCTGNISHAEYMEAVEGAVQLLTKGTKEILHSLKEDMYAASENLEFEKAARIRDRIHTIQQIEDRQKVIKDNSYADSDVFAFACDNNNTSVVVLAYRGGVLSDKQQQIYYNRSDIDELREEFITHYYILKQEIPKEIFIDAAIESAESLMRMLSEIKGHKVTVSVPVRGEKRQLINMAYSNAVEALNQVSKRSNKDEAALAELANILGLDGIPERIEAYDISNYGEDAVGGMSVFIKGQARKYEFKRFIIKSVEGVDDYASMREVLSRRIMRYNEQSKAYSIKPDLILIDGGRGHLSAVTEILDNSSFVDVPVFGMVKDSRHHTKDIVGPEGEVSLSARKNAFSLVTKIQDETHKYTVDYQRSRHTKKILRSSLLDIEGVGETRAKQLLKQFKSIENIKKATLEELKQADSIDSRTANNIYSYFHDNHQKETSNRGEKAPNEKHSETSD